MSQRAWRWPLLGIVAVACLTGESGLSAEDDHGSQRQETAMPAMIQDNMAVQFDYTLTADGQMVESTEGRAPFRYLHGQRQIISGLERQLTGLHAGDTRDLTVTPEDAYGLVDPSAFVEVPKEQLPDGLTPEVGSMLQGVDPDGRPLRATISQVNEQTVTLDLNHPLAGKTLLFKIKVVDVSPAQ